MARWEPGGQDRLTQAAMELFAERGFDATTVAEIAERAGLTKRTFFRHFADKREVLFQGSQAVLENMVAAVAAAPPSASPIDAVAAGLETFPAADPGRRAFARRRQRVIDGSPELQERELIKLDALTAALAGALRERGVDDVHASLAAQAGIAAFRTAFARWIDGPADRGYPDVLRDTLNELRAVTAG